MVIIIQPRRTFYIFVVVITDVRLCCCWGYQLTHQTRVHMGVVYLKSTSSRRIFCGSCWPINVCRRQTPNGGSSVERKLFIFQFAMGCVFMRFRKLLVECATVHIHPFVHLLFDELQSVVLLNSASVLSGCLNIQQLVGMPYCSFYEWTPNGGSPELGFLSVPKCLNPIVH